MMVGLCEDDKNRKNYACGKFGRIYESDILHAKYARNVLYYNAVLGHVKQDWLCQPCLASILLITFPIFLRRKFPAENGSVPNPDGVPSISW